MQPYERQSEALTLGFIGLFVVFALALFLPAGTVFWPAGWAFLILFIGADVALARWLLRHDPGLLQERMSGFGKPGEPAWDKVFLVGLEVFLLAWLALMGLDAVRFRWSQMPGWLQVAGAILLLGSFYLFFLTFRENPYASPAVRVQTERGQTVISTGPYQYVRHPMYAAGIIFRRHRPHAGVLVWVTHGDDLRRRDSLSSRAGGTLAARRTARL